jgi:hypothetical protein
VNQKKNENGSELMLMKNCDQNSIEISDETDNMERKNVMDLVAIVLSHLIVIAYFSYVSYRYIATSECLLTICNFKFENILFLGEFCANDCQLTLCSSYGMLLLVFVATYLGLIYYKLIKKYYGKTIYESIIRPLSLGIQDNFKSL